MRYDTFEQFMLNKGLKYITLSIDALNALREVWDCQQARIDALMLEHCPDEMSPEQLAEWERHQKPAGPIVHCPSKKETGSCTKHNLHCGWPTCNEPPEKKGIGSAARGLVARRIDVTKGGPRPVEPASHVKLPTSEVEARAMIAVGTAYLNQFCTGKTDIKFHMPAIPPSDREAVRLTKP